MKYEEKFDLVITAIREAIKARRQGQPVKLYYTDDNRLTRFLKDEIHDILVHLQDEKIIAIQRKINRLLPIEKQPVDANYIYLDILEGFEPWYEQYILKHKSSIENIDYINLLKIYDIVLDINEEIQISKSTIILIASLPTIVRFSLLFPGDTVGTRDKYRSYREDGLHYLEREGILSSVEFFNDTYYGKYQVVVNIASFEDFFMKITEEYKKRNKTVLATSQTKKTIDKTEDKTLNNIKHEDKQVIYEITFTGAREILLNGFQIAKPDFDSENEVVFNFLYQHPNKRHKQEEIETAIKKKLTKTLHKIVENLGFTGQIKKVFIDVNKDSICFRNPITQDDLDKLGIKQLKLTK